MEAKDEVKQRLSVEDVIGDYVELKRAGRNLKALSPFTAEKTASFMVSPEKQIWHDFSSNQGGDIFTFVMLMEGVDFRGAMEILARKAGVDLAQYSGGSRQNAKRKERLYEVLEKGAKYYHASLTKNKTALNYVVKERGYGQAIIKDFQLGYAPNADGALHKFLTKKGFTNQEIKDAGLAGRRAGSDMFRGRIMVPLADGMGRIIGFTGRVLDDSLPKYINTPQTLLYDKSRHVFGLHLAKEAIRQTGYAVVCEGNMDVIASHKTDVKNVVASAGTAMTRDHLSQLSRLSDDIRLAFDSDRAGIDATERSIPIAQEVGVRLSIIDIAEGKDPDELIKKDPKAWKQATENSSYVMDWLIDRYKTMHDLKTAEGKRHFTDTVLSVLARVKDPVEVEHYLRLAANLTETSFEAMSRKLQTAGQAPKRLKKAKGDPAERIDAQAGRSAYQDHLLGLNLLHPDVRASLKNISPPLFSGPARQAVAKYILDNPSEYISKVPADLQAHEDYVKIIQLQTEELYDDWSSSDRMIEAIGLARRLTRDNVTKRKSELSAKIRAAEEAGRNTERERLLKEFNQLLKEK